MYKDYASLRSDLDKGKTSVVTVTEEYLMNIKKGEHLNAFLFVFADEARERAKEIDKKIKNKTAGKLAGMIIAVKDVLSIKDKDLTCGSKILTRVEIQPDGSESFKNFKALYTATAVQRLIDEDAIIIGKT